MDAMLRVSFGQGIKMYSSVHSSWYRYCAGEAAAQQTVLQLTWQEAPTAAMAACMTAVAALWWPDDAVIKASSFLR